jgi:FixJ family two-component response regulator
MARVEARDAGCCAFLAKPCAAEELLSVLDRLVDANRSRARQA